MFAQSSIIGQQNARIKTLFNSILNLSHIPPHRQILTVAGLSSKKKEYIKKELIGYSMHQMYSVVADVANYYKFVPYVTKSLVHSWQPNQFKADLIVGFPPLNEKYTSLVKLNKPLRVQSVSKDARLFDHLSNDWQFSAGLKDIPQSCVLDFKVSFEFKSLLHSKIANLFFDLICDQMEHAFILEAGRRFGEPSIRTTVLSAIKS